MPDPTELIDYNRYAYARANPLKYNDPSGHNPHTPCCMTGPSLVPQILQLMADVAAVVLEPAGEAVQVIADHPMFGPSLGELEEMRSDLVGTYVDPYLPEGVKSAIDDVSAILDTPGVSDVLMATIHVPSVLDSCPNCGTQNPQLLRGRGAIGGRQHISDLSTVGLDGISTTCGGCTSKTGKFWGRTVNELQDFAKQLGLDPNKAAVYTPQYGGPDHWSLFLDAFGKDGYLQPQYADKIDAFLRGGQAVTR